MLSMQQLSHGPSRPTVYILSCKPLSYTSLQIKLRHVSVKSNNNNHSSYLGHQEAKTRTTFYPEWKQYLHVKERWPGLLFRVLFLHVYSTHSTKKKTTIKRKRDYRWHWSLPSEDVEATCLFNHRTHFECQHGSNAWWWSTRPVWYAQRPRIKEGFVFVFSLCFLLLYFGSVWYP